MISLLGFCVIMVLLQADTGHVVVCYYSSGCLENVPELCSGYGFCEFGAWVANSVVSLLGFI